jgi:hypothetical protein
MARQACALARRELRLCAPNIYALQACRLSAQVAQQVLSLLAFTSTKVQTLKAFFFLLVAVCSTPASPMFRRSSASKWRLSRNSASPPPAPTPPPQVLVLLYICPHTTMYLSSYRHLSSHCHISVRILQYLCPHTADLSLYLRRSARRQRTRSACAGSSGQPRR